MSVTFGIDTRHFPAEELPVYGSVFPLIESDVVMDHLMNDSILNKFFGHVQTRIDTKDEVLISQGSKEPRAPASKCHFSEESASRRKFDRYRRQRVIKEKGIVLVETGLYVRNRRNQWDLRFGVFLVFNSTI